MCRVPHGHKPHGHWGCTPCYRNIRNPLCAGEKGEEREKTLPFNLGGRYSLASFWLDFSKNFALLISLELVYMPHCLVIGYVHAVLARFIHFQVHAFHTCLPSPPSWGVFIIPPSWGPSFTYSPSLPQGPCLSSFPLFPQWWWWRKCLVINLHLRYRVGCLASFNSLGVLGIIKDPCHCHLAKSLSFSTSKNWKSLQFRNINEWSPCAGSGAALHVLVPCYS